MNGDAPDPAGTASTWRWGWPAALLPFLVLVYYAGFHASLSDPSRITNAVAGLSAMGLAGLVAWRCALRPAAALVLLAAAALALWMGLQLCCVPFYTVQLGWIGGASAALVAMAAVMSSPLPVAWWIPALGASAMAALALAWMQMELHGFNGFGFGNPNFLINCCSPPILAWAAWVAVRWLRGGRPAAGEVAAAATAIALLLFMSWRLCPNAVRRGVQVATVASTGLVILAAVWGRWRRLGMALAGAAACLLLAAGALLAQRMADDHGLGQNLRLTHYRAAIEFAPTVMPCGAGAYAGIRLDDAPGDVAREQSSLGAFLLHVHNEPLDVLISAGIPGLALWLLMAAACVAAVAGMAREEERIPMGAMLVAMAVHLMTDPMIIYDGPKLWYAMLAGAACLGAGAGAGAGGAGVGRPLRPLVLPFAVMAAVAAVREIPVSLLRRDALPEQRIAALAWTWRPQSAVDLVREIEQERGGRATPALCRQALALGRQAVPDAWQMTGIALLQAEEDGRYEDMVREELRLAHRRPFFGGYYLQLCRTLEKRPELVRLVPQRIQARLAYLSGQPNLPPLQLIWRDGTIDDAADLWVALNWAVGTGRPWEDIQPGLERLVDRYAHLVDVAAFAIRCAAHAPAGTFAWLTPYGGRFAVALRQSPTVYGALLEELAVPRKASLAWPLLGAIHPEWTEVVQGRRRPPEQMDDLDLAGLLGLARIYEASRLAVHPGWLRTGDRK